MAEMAMAEIASILGAEKQLLQPQEIINRLLFDSRQFSLASGTLFFALRGQHHHDGHNYLAVLLEKGLQNFVVEKIPRGLQGKANFLVVKDTLQAMQQLAGAVRQNSHAQILAITGSNGKTVVKEWLSQLLHSSIVHTRSPKSFNSQIGVPLSLWRLEKEQQLAIIEAGISKPGEMQHLQKVIAPTLGIFTNIGSAHAENFSSLDEKIAEKLVLFKGAAQLVYEKNQSRLSAKIETFARQQGIELLSWSFEDKEANLYLEQREQAEWLAHWQGEKFQFLLPFTDDAARQNSMHALRAALALGIKPTLLSERLAGLQPVEMRLEMKSGIQGNVIINDAYNSDLESLRLALHFLQHNSKNRDRILILSDVQQSGLPPKELYSKITDLVNSSNLNKVVAIGPDLSRHTRHFNTATEYYLSTREFIRDWPRYHFQNCAILLKGARSFRFEEISQRLEQKSHETVLNISLPALVHNLRYFRGKLKRQTRIMAMVKAFAYGSGAFEVANVLQFNGVNYLGVAYADEGVELRKAGISLPVLVLNPELNAMPEMIEYRLEPEIYSLKKLEEFARIAQEHGEQDFPIHLKLETGMNRLGFTADEIPGLVQKLKAIKQVKVESMFSHLAASDNGEEDDFTRQQIKRFVQMCDEVEKALPYSCWKHIANSAAISRFPEAHFDMVRLGISLYGAASNSHDQEHLEVVSELKASVSQIKHLQAGDTVSYGRTFKAQKPMQIAIISLGYADGFRRSLSNGRGEVFIRGKRYPTVGRVCMDMIMVDVTGSQVQEGDLVEVFGENITVQELAEKMETIPYEVFTGISQRVKRVYFME